MNVREHHLVMLPRARRTWLIWLAVAVLLSAAAWAVGTTLQRIADTRRSEVELRTALAQRRSPPVLKPSRADVELQRRWAALSAELAYSWYPLFRSLEQANSQDIELLEFVPDKVGHRVVLRGEARNFDALTGYLALLAEQDALSEVYLAHQKNLSRASITVVAFEIRATTLAKVGQGR